MRIVILPVGQMEEKVLNSVRNGLTRAFPQIPCDVSEDALAVPKSAYSHSRQQYLSTKILLDILDYAEKTVDLSSKVYRVLGVTDVDLHVPRLNFVFGEARCPGKAALISVCRLRPEFYRNPSDEKVFLTRCVKEAVHEIGHILGLRHCSDPSCVTHFSLYVGMTDRKRVGFCESCRLSAERAIGRFQHSLGP